MKKVAVVAFLAVALAGCETTNPTIVQTKIEVVTPSEALYNCPTIRNFPAVATLTDVQVARLITQLHRNNVTCKNSIEAIKKFVESSKASMESE